MPTDLETEPAIALRGVAVDYGGVRFLSGLDLELANGRTTVLIGPSGCGKSTILRLAVGLVRPAAGRVVVEGTELSEATELQLRRKIGYVIQEGGLFPHLSARDNAALLARHLGWDEARIAVRLDELAELAHLPGELLDRFPGELSGGQRQRVGLLRALMLDPDLLLLDEPLGALDPMIRVELQEDLRAIFRELGKTVVLVTHDLSEAAFLGDEIVLLREGAVVQRGGIDALLREPADDFVRRFVSAQRSSLEDAP